MHFILKIDDNCVVLFVNHACVGITCMYLLQYTHRSRISMILILVFKATIHDFMHAPTDNKC